MIIELYGNPGAGKTYIINTLKCTQRTEKLRKNSVIRSSLLAAAKWCTTVMPSSLKIKKQIKLLLMTENNKPIYNQVSVNRYINKILLLAFSYKYLSKKRIVMDEGLIHRIISMSINYGISTDTTFKIIDLFQKYLINLKIFYLSVSVDECFRSVKERDRHRCGIDELTDEQLRDFISDYEVYCNIVCERYKHIKINRDNWEVIKETVDD